MNIATLESRISRLEERIAKLESMLTSVTSDGAHDKSIRIKKTLSPKEFLLDYRPTNDVQVTLLLGYYAEQVQQMNSFKIKDLEQLFQEARMPKPSNLNDKVNQNISKGYLMITKEKKDAKKAWVVTRTGESAVEGMKLIEKT